MRYTLLEKADHQPKGVRGTMWTAATTFQAVHKHDAVKAHSCSEKFFSKEVKLLVVTPGGR